MLPRLSGVFDLAVGAAIGRPWAAGRAPGARDARPYRESGKFCRGSDPTHQGRGAYLIKTDKAC